VRQHDQLRRLGGLGEDLENCLLAPEGILAVERVIEDDDALGEIRLALQVGEEEREREGGAVAGAQGVTETGLVDKSYVAVAIPPG